MPNALTSPSVMGFSRTQLCDIACLGILPTLRNEIRSVSPGFAVISVTLNCIASLPVISITLTDAFADAVAAGAGLADPLSDLPQAEVRSAMAARLERTVRVFMGMQHHLNRAFVTGP